MAIYNSGNLPADGYDTHTHLNDDTFWHDVPAYEARAHEFRIVEMNIVGYDAESNERAIQLAREFKDMHAIIGWQPEDISEINDERLAVYRQQLQDDNVIGVGETGLDYYWDDNPSAANQKQAFRQQLALAHEFKLPVTVHTRSAMNDTYNLLKEAHVEEFGGVMHSFTGTPAEAKQFLDLGMYISFSGIATFKNAKDVQETVKSIPLDRLLVETDAPYFAPTPMRGKPNEPMYVHYIIAHIAELLGKTYNEIAEITTENARRLWHLDQQTNED